MIKHEEIASALALVAGAYPNFTVTQQVATAWSALLGDLAPGSVLAATRVMLALRTSQWPPTVGEVRDVAFGGAFEDDDGTLAWGTVLAEMQRLGSHVWSRSGWPTMSDEELAQKPSNTTPQPKSGPERLLLDDLTLEALQVVFRSWRDLFEGTPITHASNRARFLSAWKALAKRRRVARALPPGWREDLHLVMGGHPRALAP